MKKMVLMFNVRPVTDQPPFQQWSHKPIRACTRS